MKQHDYKKLGLKMGLEIHQQLPGKKLFCNCPCVITDQQPDYTIERTLRATAGEEGKVDLAALYEQQKQKSFQYHCYDEYTCLVELDEEPPHQVNPEALKTALIVAKLLSCK